MSSALSRKIRGLLGRLGIGITTSVHLNRLIDQSRLAADIDFVLTLPDQHAAPLLRVLPCSKSQLRQDLFVLSALEFKENGYFVEFGAADGVLSSNTYLLEKEYGWTGILAEPARMWRERLRENRSCNIETDCVWRESGSHLTFNETRLGEHSTIDSFSGSDLRSAHRKRRRTYSVGTISLEDLLRKYHAPETIDYLSIDTEGSEYEILSNFDFSRYRFRVITCEHNFTPAREKIFSLLSSHGYTRRLTEFSQYDDWYLDTTMP
ncbi:MAG: FkbM family methyltransferase [Terracidiphilus sp.]